MLPAGEIDQPTLAALEAQAATVLGHGGPGDRTDGVARPLGLVMSVDPTIGGNNTITTGIGADIVIGGRGNNTITTNRGETAAMPDAGGVAIGSNGQVEFQAG